ncbi:DUF1196 domain-containing protein, partial [Vibrio cholerae]|nr:DUF1196 domain-containing protein [Vibrio cholerae]
AQLKPTAVTTSVQWDWKRYALTVPLEAFVMCLTVMPFMAYFQF